jgi:hypothetical protein
MVVAGRIGWHAVIRIDLLDTLLHRKCFGDAAILCGQSWHRALLGFRIFEAGFELHETKR